MDQKSEIVADWRAHTEWGFSTRIFENKVADYCRDAVPEQFVEDSALIIRELVRNLLDEPLKAIGVLMESQRIQLKLVIHSIGDGFWKLGYQFHNRFLDLGSERVESYHETTLTDPLPVILLYVLKRVMSLAGQYGLFEGTTNIAVFEKQLQFE